MGIENGQQVLPTEGFEDFADETKAEEDAYEDQINDDQPLNDEDVATLEGVSNEEEDEDSDDTADEETDSESEETGETAEDESETEEAKVDEAETDVTESESEPEPKPDEPAAETPQEISKREKFERYSRSVQRRINKEVKQREALKTENDTLRQRLDGIEAKMTKDSDESEANVLANRLRNATAVKQQFMEDGEYEKVTQVDNDIVQMKIQQAKLEERAQQQQYKEPDAKYEASAETEQQVEAPEIQKQWMANNERFGKDQAYTGYVNATYDQMVEEGYDPEDGNMYTELDRRTGRTPPESKPEVKAEVKPALSPAPTTPEPKPKPRPKAAPTPSTVQAQRKSKAKGITEADKANMRNWGLDPSDKSVRKEWLANKRKKT